MNTNTDTIATPAANDAREVMDISYLATLASRPVFSGLYQPEEPVAHQHHHLCRSDCPF